MTGQAEVVERQGAAEPAVTSELAALLRRMWSEPLDARAATVGKQCLLDWLGVSLAARREPLVDVLIEEFAGGGAGPQCALVGRGRRAPLHEAVLINGAMGHALDFDDVLAVMGHPTVPVAPVAFGLGEAMGKSGAAVLTALVVGVEAEARVGVLLGPSHYAKGWHGTATFGTFGAAVAAASLLDLDQARLLHAFGLAGTQAAGLKSVFGTMSKPLHAGKAAQSGLLAARLAARGFTSDTAILDDPQGFAATQSTTIDPAAALQPRDAPHVTDTLFKYHAACYLTHNTIEAASALRALDGVTPDQVERVSIEVQPMHLGVCDIAAPATGLETKFSLRMTCALALSGEDTFDDRLYSDETAARPDLAALCRRSRVEGTASGLPSTVTVVLKDGRVLSRTANVAEPERDLEAQQARLERKFRHLTREILQPAAADDVIGFCRTLEAQHDLGALIGACTNGLRQ